MEAELYEPAAAPDPVSLDRVDHKADDCRVDAVREELRAFRHTAGNYRCRSGTEHEVEHERRPVEIAVVRENAESRHSAESRERVLAHHQTEAEKCENNGSYTKVH